MSRIYAMVVAVEADDAEEAARRVEEEVYPEPANAHFVGDPVEVRRSERYTSDSLARQIAGEPARKLVAAEAASGVSGSELSGSQSHPIASGWPQAASERPGAGEPARIEPCRAAPSADADAAALVLVPRLEGADGSLAAASALACAAIGSAGASLLIDLDGPRPRPTLLATAAAKALEGHISSSIGGDAVSARGGFCKVALPADTHGFEAAVTALDAAAGVPAVIHLADRHLPALLRSGLAPRAGAVMLCSGQGSVHEAAQPRIAELLSLGLLLAVLERRLSWVKERRALFGSLRAGDLPELPQALRRWLAGGLVERGDSISKGLVR